MTHTIGPTVNLIASVRFDFFTLCFSLSMQDPDIRTDLSTPHARPLSNSKGDAQWPPSFEHLGRHPRLFASFSPREHHEESSNKRGRKKRASYHLRITLRSNILKGAYTTPVNTNPAYRTKQVQPVHPELSSRLMVDGERRERDAPRTLYRPFASRSAPPTSLGPSPIITALSTTQPSE